MKKLFLFSVLLMAALFSANAFAQQHVYINDHCTNGKPSTNFWNPNKVSDVGAITMGGTPWPAWFYDPQGQIFGESVTDKIQGLYTIESNIIRVDTTGNLVFKMDFFVITLTKSNMRDFGVRIRLNSGNEWDTIFTLRQDGVFPAYSRYQETAEVLIGEKYNGKNIVLQIFFYNDALANDAFLMAFSNMFLASYGFEPKVETQLLSRQFTYGDTYTARLNCINQSATPFTSIEYAYSVNGKAEKKQEVSFADTLKGISEAAVIDFAFDIKEADIDMANKIQLWPVAVDGKDYAPTAGDTLNFDLTVVDEARLDQDYVPMLECFTSATCAPCRQMNPYLNPVLAELKVAGKLNVVKYQMNWPGSGDKYYISGNGTRRTFYGVESVPTLVLYGQEKPIPENGSYYPSEVVNTLRDMVEDVSRNKSFFTIKVNKAEVTPESVVELDFSITSHLPGATNRDMKVYAMIIEGTTRGNKVSVAEKEFHYVNMAFATPATGKVSYFSQEKTNNYTYSVDMKNTHMEEPSDLQVVIFVQDPEDKYIYQSAGVVMGDGDHAAVEDQELAQVSVYPNPAAHMVYVSGLEKAHVEIFDLGGRKVYENTDADGVLEVSLASFAKGAYVVRIAQNGAVASRKLVVK